MIYYYIPDFFYHYNVNIKLLELMKESPEMFYDDFKIGAVFGNFPNCTWNGGGYTVGKYVDYSEQLYISQMFNDYGVPLRLTMTNPIIEQNDCYDRFANYIMKNCENGFNQVLVANPILERYIRENYPKYPIVRSILAAENEYYDTSDKYFMTVLKKTKNNDLEYLKSIEKKDKIEMLINETCPEDCPRAYSHYKDFAKKQLFITPTNEDIITACSQNRTYPFLERKNLNFVITRDKIKEIYEPMGFQHFKISGRGSHGKVIIEYSNYMVKPEYKDDFLALMMDAVCKDNS